MIDIVCNKGHYAGKWWNVGEPRTVGSMDDIDKSTVQFWDDADKKKVESVKEPVHEKTSMSQISDDQQDEEEGLFVSRDKDTPPEYLDIYEKFTEIGAPFDKRWGIKRLNKEYKKAVKKAEGKDPGGKDEE